MERLTPEYLESQIVRTQFFRPEGCGTLTTCVLTMKNGLFITGESACLNPADFDAALGEKYARENAFSKLWKLEGYARASAAIQKPLYIVRYPVETDASTRELASSALAELADTGAAMFPDSFTVEVISGATN